jgi:hypothetical protein
LNKNLLTKFALLAVSVVLTSWGSTGHEKINRNSSLSFSQEMSQFNVWTNTLADHASDADYRKNSDPTEAPKHFIDIDSYYGFIVTGRIPQTWDSIIAAYHSDFVNDNGILPWATVTTVDTLRACFQRNDWAKAVLVASDLGHYVGDGHMPLHITENYNGQNSGNYGIHSRYETTMINNYRDLINYEGDSLQFITNVNQYVFDYIYHNYTYKDSVLDADDYAMVLSGGDEYSTIYKQALWDNTKGFTIPLFKNASHALAELIYTAWVQAGSPSMTAASVFEQDANNAVFLDQNIPNPFLNSTQISYSLLRNSNVLLQVKDAAGNIIETLSDEYKTVGCFSTEWKPRNLPAGIYYLVLKTGNSIGVKKMVLIE